MTSCVASPAAGLPLQPRCVFHVLRRSSQPSRRRNDLRLSRRPGNSDAGSKELKEAHKETPIPPEKTSVTHHELTLGGKIAEVHGDSGHAADSR